MLMIIIIFIKNNNADTIIIIFIKHNNADDSNN